MRGSVGLGMTLRPACGGGLKPPETIPVPAGVPTPVLPAIALPAVDTSASPGAGGGAAGRARIAAEWPLRQRVKAVAREHGMVVTAAPLASDVGVGISR